MGRPPKPTALKIVQGNPGKRALNTSEPQPRRETPTCPAWLSVEAKREWRKMTPELERLGLLTVIDGAALAGYCQAYARWKQAEALLDREGLVITTQSGYSQPHPAVAIAQKSLALVRAFCSEFGLTPAARSSLHVAPLDKPESPFAALKSM